MSNRFILTAFGLNALNATVFPNLPTSTNTGVSGGHFGLPVFDKLILEEDAYYERGNPEPVTYNGLTIESVLITVTQTKRIVTTQIQGKDTTVKEYISKGDYQISIQGVLAGKGDVFPQDELETFITFCNVPSAVSMYSNFLNLFGIYKVVISDYTYNQLEGYNNMVSFNITALSDFPVDLIIKE